MLFIAIVLMTTAVSSQVFERDEFLTRLLRLDSKGWTAGDGSITVPLPDKRRIWLFGDSYLVNVRQSDTTVPCIFQVRNAVVVQDGEKFQTLLDSSHNGIERTFFREYPFDTAHHYWSGSGFVEKDTVYTFQFRIDSKTLKVTSTCFGKLHYPDLSPAAISPIGDLAGISFGVGVLQDSASGYYYAYGVRANGIVFEPYVARFTSAAIMSWEYYTGGAWSPDPAKAVAISAYGMSASYGVIKHNNSYFLISQENGFLTPGLGRHIYAYRSQSPTGPFTKQLLLYTIEDTWKGQYLVTYNAMPHSEIYEDSLSISYNVNGNDSTCRKNIWIERLNADCYRPKFIAVPYSVLEQAKTASAASVSMIPVVSLSGYAGCLQVSASHPLQKSMLAHVADLRGKMVKLCDLSRLPISNSFKLDLTSLANGTYIFVLTCDKQDLSLGFVKMGRSLFLQKNRD